MRWGRAVVVAVVVAALAACGGGGQKSNATATGSASNGSAVGAGAEASGPNESGSAGDAQIDGGSAAADADNGGAPAGGPSPSNTDAPAPSGLKPFAGKYTYHATGTTSLNGPPSSVDVQAVTTIEDLNDDDQRATTTGGGGGAGDQVQVLRYSSDKIELLSLEMTGAVHKVFNGPVLFAPVPGSVGQAWAWDLTSTDALTHVHQSSRIDRTETVTIGGQSVDTVVVETDLTFSGDINGSGHLTSWVSPIYKVGVRSHSTLDATYATFHLTSDITADLLDLRPS
ncbi:MAG: hypothetical protein QOI95_3348 [Acidimicrobiaceae bacterium]|jgi:hypothetical protein